MFNPPEYVSVHYLHVARALRNREGGGRNKARQETKEVCAGERETILVRYLLCQYQTRTQLPVRLHVLQGSGKKRYLDHTRVQSCDRDYNPLINPAYHVQNEFLNFRLHELTKINEYELVLLSKHVINR